MTTNKEIIVLTDVGVDDSSIIEITLSHKNNTLMTKMAYPDAKNVIISMTRELLTADPTIDPNLDFSLSETHTHFNYEVSHSFMKNNAKTYLEGKDSHKFMILTLIVFILDKHNQNVKVSEGIKMLITDMELKQKDETEVLNPIIGLMNILFEQDIWNVGHQGVRILEGSEVEFGEAIEFTTCFAVGNVFVEGKIGKLGIRIFKTQIIQAYIGWGTEYPDRPEIFQNYDRDKFYERLIDMVEISANSPA